MTKTPAKLPIGFKSIFWAVVGLTILSLGTAVYLATRPSEQQHEAIRDLTRICNTTWKIGIGGILGLLGGRRSA